MNMKILAKFKFGIGASQHITSSLCACVPRHSSCSVEGGSGDETSARVAGSIAFLSLEFANLQEI